MSTIRERKEQVVSEIEQLIDSSKSLVVVNYHGINTEDDTALRKQLRENGVQYKVLKNTMVALALKARNIEGLDAYLEGPNAFAFGADETTAAKILKKFAADKKKLELKGGYVGGVAYDANQIKTLADIPSREELLAKFLGSIKSPVSNFAYMVKAVADKKAEAGEA